jgi:subtilase family serine protease
MNEKKRTIIAFLLVLGVVGVLGYEFTVGEGVFGNSKNYQASTLDTESNPLPDLEANLDLNFTDNNELIAELEIKNIGEGIITGDTPFDYTLYLGNTELFSNTDSYSEMAQGDSFSFNYPVSEYPEKGSLRFEVDSKNSINEIDETNNSKELNY